MTSPTAAAARRSRRLGRRTLAGERRLDDANGGHQRVERDAANSPVTKTTAEEQRTAPATKKKRRKPSGRRRRRRSGGLRRRRRGGRGRRRPCEPDGGLPERQRRLERRRRTAGAAAATAKLGYTVLGLFQRREAKAKGATGRGDIGGPYKGVGRRRRRPTAAGDEKERLKIRRKERNPIRPRIHKFPNRIRRRFQRRKGRGDREDHLPSTNSAGEGKTWPNLEGDGGGSRLGFAGGGGARRTTTLTSGPHLSATARERRAAARRIGPAGPRERERGKERGFGPAFGPKPKEDF
uniref:Uncharacterized protein n=1 Tax=Oryza sativa subsp. japonica TaxID=39947 RepID=Q6H4Y1_ORYSJ|nr:hypothetical protein [Oryza sativa Japonica Group]BAD26218.1 hypothetical protein [Oryza sativa Japonica Group]